MIAILSSWCPYIFSSFKERDLPLRDDIEAKLLAVDTEKETEELNWDAFTEWSIPRRRLYVINPFLAITLGRIDTPGAALDLGSGIGDDTFWLLRHKWEVTAVDICQKAVEALRSIKFKKLEVVHSSIEEYRPTKKFDFILAVNSLGFCTPSKVAMIWDRTYASLNKGGYILCTFPLTTKPTKWSLTRDEIESLFVDKKFRVIKDTTLSDPEASHSLVLILQKI